MREAPDATARPPIIHPLVVRITHWINAFAMVIMVMSGWKIYDASPIWNFMFPHWMTLGGWLAGALGWHFAAFWLLIANGVVYVAYGFASGHFRRNFRPLSVKAIWRDFIAALTFRLEHRIGTYNAVQKALYITVLLMGLGVVLSGFAIWKPVQFQFLTGLLGGYDTARIVHFAMMSGIVGFVLVHLSLVVLVPSTLLPMFTGRALGPDRHDLHEGAPT